MNSERTLLVLANSSTRNWPKYPDPPVMRIVCCAIRKRFLAASTRGLLTEVLTEVLTGVLMVRRSGLSDWLADQVKA